MKFNFIDSFYFIIVIFFSFTINQYYGFVGINPLDQFTIFNSGYLFINDNLPFRDYWTITGPLLDIIQKYFFIIFGLNWTSYVLHASIFNTFLAIGTFLFFKKNNLNVKYCCIYSVVLSFLFYPIIGTPFVDHHSFFFSIMSLYIFILAIKKEEKKYWILLPLFFLLGFLSKQTPISYVLILILFSLLYYFILFEKKFVSYLLFSSLIYLILLIFYFLNNSINFSDFINQYIFFASSIGSERMISQGFLLPIEFKRFFWRFKLIHISYFVFIFLIIKEIKKNFFFYKNKDFIIFLTIIFFNNIFIVHQLLTLNTIFIYFLIPINIGISHFYLNKYFKNNNLINILLIFCLISSSYYFIKYVHFRKFSDFTKSIITKSTYRADASLLTYQLHNLQWLSSLSNNPDAEIKNLLKIVNYLKEVEKSDKRNAIIITDYQFIFSAFDIKNKQLIKWYHPGVSYPVYNNKYFLEYKRYAINFIKTNNISKIIFIYPSLFKNENYFFLNLIPNQCYSLIRKKNNVVIYNINKCNLLTIN